MNLHELNEDYEILGELGRGGTAIVYRARERELGRDVAIKVVRSTHLDDQEAVARLAREAKLVAQLRHPNIVPLLGVRRLADGLALIMQHVPGRTLKAAIREVGPMPVALVEHVLREIGSALDYAHKRHGIVHRDIKPENIYLDDEINRALLSDFGIARGGESESSLTMVGTALGTPAYMSPEQIDGSFLDGRSDLYSLGLVAYEMLTGQQPWAGSNLYTIIYKQKNEQLPPISTVRKDVPRYVERVIETLLRKNASERYSDAVQMIAEMPSGGGPIELPAAPAAPIASPVIPYDDAPTVRYQRPTFTIFEPHHDDEEDVVTAAEPAEEIAATPAPEPVTEIAAESQPEPEPEPAPEPIFEPAFMEVVEPETEPVLAIAKAPVDEPEPVAAASAVASIAAAAVEAAFAESDLDVAGDPVPEKASPRLGWRLPRPRMRGGLAANSALEPDEQPVPILLEEPMELAARDSSKLRLVAGITIFLVLSGTATVVAMRDMGDADTSETLAAALPSAAQPTASLVKASDVPASAAATSKEGAPKAPASKDEPRDETDENSDEPQIQMPRVSLPDIAVAGNSGISEADFSAGVTAPTGTVVNVRETPSFTPHTVKPELRNREVVMRALTEYYPPVLRERKIGGTVGLWVLIDTAGRVIRSQVRQSSGNEFLDDAAAKVAGAMQFSPALDRDKKVSVWIQLPIIFRTQ